MKKSFLIISLIVLFGLPSIAEVAVDSLTNREFLQNEGYSTAVINAVEKSKAASNGKEYNVQPEKEYYTNPFVKFVRRVVMYLDPGLDDGSFMNHDIHTAPNYEDL